METFKLDALRDSCYRHRVLCRQIARGSGRHSALTFTRTIGRQPRAWARAANPQGAAFAQLTSRWTCAKSTRRHLCTSCPRGRQ